MDGINTNFPGGNTNMLQQMSNYSNMQNIPSASVQSPNTNNNNNTSELNPKRQAVFDRLKKRMNLYRKRQNESIPRFDQTFSGICEQQSVETNVLQKRFVESKAKRVAKKADKKQTDVVPNSANVVRNLSYNKRNAPRVLNSIRPSNSTNFLTFRLNLSK